MRIKENKLFYMQIFIVVIFLYLICMNVFLNGDDYMYGFFAKNGIIENIVMYYFTGNGRFWINILDVLLLWFDRYLFVIVNPIIIMIFIVALERNVFYITGNFKGDDNQIIIGIILFLCLDILCLRETVFWITGMMNYLFPAMLFLIATQYFLSIRNKVNVKLKQKLIFWIICFFAASSVEQYALMYVGMMTLMTGYDIWIKKNIEKYIVIGYAISIIGLLILIFAPGNFVRIGDQVITRPTFIDNVWTLIYQDTISPVAFPFILMLSVCGAIILREASRNILSMISIILPGLLLLVRCVPVFEKAIIITGIIILFLIEMIGIFVFKQYEEKPIICAYIFVGIGSQIMLLISAIWGFRCMFSLYVVYMILIMFLLSKMQKKYIYLVLSTGVLASIIPGLVWIFWILYGVINQKNAFFEKICKVMIGSLSIMILLNLAIGYAANRETYCENNINSEETKEEIVLTELPNETYSWYSIPMNEFHERYYKMYYGIPENYNFKYIESVDRRMELENE